MQITNSWLNACAIMAATVCGVGFMPLCPGSAACVVAVLVFVLIKDSIVFAFLTLCSVILAYSVCTRAERVFAVKDCKKIVIDDFAGMLITYLFIPREPIFIVAGFFLFRMLDMIKIPPADRVERLTGSRGIVGDDVVAGIYASGILQAVRLLLKISS